jgi:hypothetical protein
MLYSAPNVVAKISSCASSGLQSLLEEFSNGILALSHSFDVACDHYEDAVLGTNIHVYWFSVNWKFTFEALAHAGFEASEITL